MGDERRLSDLKLRSLRLPCFCHGAVPLPHVVPSPIL